MLKKLILPFLSPLLLFFACTVDTGLQPTHSGISGTVFFENDWPEQTDQVIVVAATKFPPTSLEDIIMSEPLDTFVDSLHYTIWANPETFNAVGVVWKEVDQPWDVTNIIGIYFPTSDHFTPGSVTIPDRDTVVDSINIAADLSLARRKVDSGLSGQLSVVGDWPAGATSVLMVASKTILPTSLLDVVFGSPITAGFDSTTYSLSLQPGTWRLIGALVIVEGENIGFESIKGVYKKKPSDFLPGTVVIPTDTTQVSGINIALNFETGPLQ